MCFPGSVAAATQEKCYTSLNYSVCVSGVKLDSCFFLKLALKSFAAVSVTVSASVRPFVFAATRHPSRSNHQTPI